MNNNINYQFERTHDKYPADHVYALKPTNVFQGQVTRSEIDPYPSQYPKTVRIIDDAIAVESIDEKTRAAALHHFSVLQHMASLDGEHHSSGYYQGIAATVMGLGLSIGSIILLPIPSFIGAVAGAAISSFGLLKTVRNNTAIQIIENEIDSLQRKQSEWKDPIESIITQRKLAGSQGFQYAYKNDLKEKVVHPQEVQQLWLQDFSKLLGGHQRIQQVCEENLLSSECVTFAWNQPTLPDIEIAGRYFSASTLKTLTSQFNFCRSSFLNFEIAINNEFSMLNNQKKILKKEIADLRTRWLYPAKCLHTQARKEADYLYENALQPFIQEKNIAIEKVRLAYRYDLSHPFDHEEMAYKNQLDLLCEEEIRHICSQYDTHPAVLSIKRAYESDHRKCDFLYTQSKLVVDAFFDARLRTLERTYQHAKNQIEEQRAAGHQNYQALMDTILSDAGNPSFLNLKHPASVQRNWNLPSSLTEEPSWNEVYGQVPTFQSTFRNDISELGWNQFWSGNGLGRFASYPTSSWSQLSQERIVLPFKQHLFDLHHVPVRHDTGMFMREVRVPTLTRNCAPRVVPGTRAPVNAHPPVSHFPTTTHRSETHVTPGVRTPVYAPTTGFASTTRREDTHVTPGMRNPTNTQPATGFASTSRREDTRVTPGMRNSVQTPTTGFGGSTQRGETHANSGMRVPVGTRR